MSKKLVVAGKAVLVAVPLVIFYLLVVLLMTIISIGPQTEDRKRAKNSLRKLTKLVGYKLGRWIKS